MVLIVSHDAGGAEIISSWVIKQNEKYSLVVDGPAINIFQRKLGNYENLSLSEAISNCDWVLCGTSWESDLERQAIVNAKAQGKKVVAYLDHWVNYLDRFILDGICVLPDEIWVGDIDAESIAHNIFPSLPIVLQENPYFVDIKFDFEKLESDLDFNEEKSYSILYVCEPVREHALLQYGDERYWGYTEEEALEYFFDNIELIGLSDYMIKIRPHPSEQINKYNWAKKKNENVKIGGDRTLIEEIASSDVVVGGESMAMVIGLLADKRVISCIPPGGHACRLPQTGIEHLQILLEKRQNAKND